MILLVATTDKLQLVTGTAVTVDVHVSGVESVSSGLTAPGSFKQNTAISTAATTDICTGPSASNTRNAKTLNIRNRDAAANVDVTVLYNQNGTTFELMKATLGPGDVLEYLDGVGWFTVTARGVPPVPVVSTSDQSIGASVTAYFTSSGITIPTNRPCKVGTVFRWWVTMTKTGAGTAAATFDVRVGTAGTTADTSRGSLSTGTQSAVADTLLARIQAVVRGPISASCLLSCSFDLAHNLAATGFGPTNVITGQTISGTFDITTASLIFGLSVTTGASHAYTVQQVVSEVMNI